MDAVLTAHTPDQSLAPYNYDHIRIKTSPKKNRRGIVSKPFENFDINGGVLHPPTPNSVSFSVFNHQYRQNQQPPLLPSPNSALQHLPLLSRSLSQGRPCPLSNPKHRTSRDLSLTPRKSKPTKREEVMKRDLKSATQSISEFLIVASENRLGPEPNDLPKHLPLVLTSSSSSSTAAALTGNRFGTVSTENIESFSGSVFNLSPPPSSLPLPKFSLKPKLGCNAEAAGIDTGATDNLRRLLRLR